VKKSSDDAYRPGDAAAKNAELRKSRELKQALLANRKAAVGHRRRESRVGGACKRCGQAFQAKQTP
jgi:hypothetical protein